MLLTRLGIPKLWGEDPERLWPYMRAFIAPVARWLAPGWGYGAERVPRCGGAVLAANHLSAIDHPVIGIYCPRAVYYIAKAELLEMPVIGEILTWTGAFPVRRGEGDREALRRARDVVRDGHVVGVHVEGTRQRFGYPGRVHTGGLMIAMQEGAPVIPVGLETFRWSPLNRRPCSVVFGETLDLSGFRRNREGYRQAADFVGEAILRLWRQAAEAIVAGFPERLPDGTLRSEPLYGEPA